MDPKILSTIVFAAVVGWAVWRRVRRTFGRQPLNEGRLWFRIGFFVLIGGLVIATSAARNAQTVEALIAGLVCGAALAYVGLRHTQFEVTPQGRFYTPHTYIGIVVIALFLGRLLYRFIYLSYGTQAMAGANQNLAVAYQRNPLTLGIFAVFIAYYVVFYGGVLLKSRTPALPVGASPTE